jgi:hypothetical protein
VYWLNAVQLARPYEVATDPNCKQDHVRPPTDVIEPLDVIIEVDWCVGAIKDNDPSVVYPTI